MTALGASAGRDRLSGRAAFRRRTLTVVSLLISAACLYLALRDISPGETWDRLRSASYVWLLPCIALTLATGWVRAVRWRLLFSDPHEIRGADSFAATSIGLMFNNLLPSRAGELVRIVSMRRLSGRSSFEVGTTILVERFLDVFVLAAFGLALWPWLPDRGWIDALGFVCLACVAGGVVVVAALGLFGASLRRLLVAFLSRLPRVSPARAERVDAAVAAGVAVLRRPRRLLVALVASVAVWAVAGASGAVLFPAFGLDAGSLAPWLLLVANSFALVIPSSPGTVGVYEASVQAALVAFGLSASAALSFAVLLHAINFFPIIVVGAGAAWYTRRRAPAG